MNANPTVMLPGPGIGVVINSPKYGTHIAVVDPGDYGRVAGVRWNLRRSGSTSYASASMPRSGGKQRGVLMHRVLLPSSEMVDHRDGNGLNNRRGNLRPVSAQENSLNKGSHSNNTTGFKGVSRRKDCDRWQARIGVDNQIKALGTFRTAEEAARAYDEAAWANGHTKRSLNFPREVSK